MKKESPEGRHHFLSRIHVCLFPVLLLVAVTASPNAGRAQSSLLEEDCVKCHRYQLKMIKNAGGKHATEVSCLDCHPRHLPEKGNTVSPCDSCHAGQPHYEIDGCLHCHADPHRPLAALRDPTRPLRAECLSCHAEVGEAMRAAEGLHAGLFCTRCHDRHGYLPDCLDCHKPHLLSQPRAACRRCHPPHTPQQVKPAGWVPASYCGACHRKEREGLATTASSHGVLNCVFCHKGPHPSSHSCHDCHGLPHDQALHSQYRRCLSDCHGDAHRLISRR